MAMLVRLKSRPHLQNESESRAAPVFPAMAAIAVIICAAWSNSWSVPFLLDDVHSVTANRSIRDFWSLGWMFPPSGVGETVGGRPVLNFSFALNYAFGGTDVRVYHLTNVVIHVLAAWALFGVLRLIVVRAGQTAVEACWFALSVACLWAVHPLQTAAVTYVSQRAESLCGLFSLVAFYAFLRGADSRSHRWSVLCVTLVVLGVLTKETAVVVPVVIFLYDAVFIAGSCRHAFKARRWLYCGLAVALFALAVVVVSNSGRGGTAGFGSGITAWNYFLTQAKAIVTYLCLTIWPTPLTFDYGTPTISALREVAWQILILGAVFLASVWGLVQKTFWGFAGVSFFLLLAPSSSFVPVSTQTMAEHRMYLPLFIPLIFAVWGMTRPVPYRLRWCGRALIFSCAASLAAATFVRNETYRGEVSLWEDTTRKAPNNARAFNNWGQALLKKGETNAARRAFEKTLVLEPQHAPAHYNLGTLLLREERLDAAELHFASACASDPTNADAFLGRALSLDGLGKKAQAITQYERALELSPKLSDARVNLSALYRASGRTTDAISILRDGVQLSPQDAELRFAFGRALMLRGEMAAAREQLEAATQLNPDWAPAYVGLGDISIREGNASKAEACYRRALTLDPHSADAHVGLGNVFAARENFSAAMEEYRSALSLNPSRLEARANLGNCLLVTGKIEDAIACYDEVLKRDPDYVGVRQNRALAAEFLRTNPPLR